MSLAQSPVSLARWLLILALPVFFLNLGANSIWDANEAFYVETPRQMVQSGDYITPTFNGQKRLNKPVLSYWIVAGLYRAFGDSVTVERVGIAMGAMGVVASAFLIGRALRSTATGLLAALFVATAPRVIFFARRIFIDIYVTMFMSLALACFVLAERIPQRRRMCLLLMYVCVGLGVLTKGPAFIAVPALVAVAWVLVEKRLTDVKRWLLAPGAAVIAAIVLPWYVALYARHGWEYIRTFLFVENLGRYTTAMTPGGRGWFFYVPVVLGDLFPWAPLVLFPLAAIPLAWRRQSSSADPVDAIRRLLWLWIAGFVLVFSFSRTKEDLYVFPIVAAVAALVADALVEFLATPRQRVISAIFVCVAVTCIAGGGVLYWLFGPAAGYYAIQGAGMFAALLAATGLAAVGLWWRKPAAAIAALAAGFIALNYVLVFRVLPGVERTKPVPPLVHTLAERAVPNAKIGYFNMGLQSFVYYTGRGAIEEIGSIEQAHAFFFDRRESWALMGQPEWEAIRAIDPRTCIVASHSLSVFDANLSDIIRRKPPVEVLLVKNNCVR